MSITSHYTATHRTFRRVGREHGLHPTAVRVALAIDEHGTTSPVRLGEALGTFATAAGRGLRQLEAAGALDRFGLTELGERIADAVREGARG